MKSVDEWNGNEDASDEDEPIEESGESDDELMGGTETDGDDENTQESLVVQLRYRKDARSKSPAQLTNGMALNGHKPQLANSPLGQVQSVDQFSPVKQPQQGLSPLNQPPDMAIHAQIPKAQPVFTPHEQSKIIAQPTVPVLNIEAAVPALMKEERGIPVSPSTVDMNGL